MSYDNIPRPDIERHYHIRDLIEAQEKRADDRSYHRQKEKDKEERIALIKDNPGKVVTDFYCNKCRRDFRAESIKEVEIDWSNTAQYIAYYKTKCPIGHWCIRLITDKQKDTYWIQSKAVNQDRGKHYKDTIQPHETGFNMLYKKI